DYQILLGYNQLNNPSKYSVQVTVYKLIVHKDYGKIHHQGSDIALMQLHTPVEYNTHVLPACVPERNTRLPTNKPCWTSGWGMITEGQFAPYPRQLREIELVLMDNEICKSFFPPPFPGATNQFYVYEDMVCAADYQLTKSICKGLLLC
uniref:Peptidase S1 domain-containing protein n=1 Tax=Nannospalax galili TaxID=1026970 RepID=A0A8C6RFF0_NANGA